MVSATLFISLALFLVLSVPVGIAIGLSTVAAVVAGGRLSLGFVPQALVTGLDSFPVLAVPMFILAGELMSSGGVSRRILNVCNVFFGRFTGGMAIVAVAMAMFFSAVSGSAPATVAAVGTMVVPMMVEKGYSKGFSLGLIAAAGCVGVILPPSIPMVFYGVATGTSVAALFMAGFFPGILFGLCMAVFCYFYCKKMGWKGDENEIFTWVRALKAMWEAKWAFINPFIILGGIYGGFFTPTEAAGVAAVYALVCGCFIHKEMNASQLWEAIARSCATTATAMIILGAATAFARVLTIEQIPMMLANFMIGLTDNWILMLLYINIFLLLVGLVIDPTPAMLILAPILLPVARSFGVHPVHFGIIMVINLSIGFITPPIGVNLFVASRIGNERLDVVSRGVLPFVAVAIICLMIVTFVPWLSLYLPTRLL